MVRHHVLKAEIDRTSDGQIEMDLFAAGAPNGIPKL